MDALSGWSLGELVDRVMRERLVDACMLREEHVIILQGSTRIVLDHHRAHAFLRGILRGMSPSFRRPSSGGEDGASAEGPRRFDTRDHRTAGLIDMYRRHLVTKWWSRYEAAGFPCSRSISGLMLWIRYNTGSTVN